MELGKDVAEETLQARIANLAPNKCCTLIYTVSSSKFLFGQRQNCGDFSVGK